jgi:hypothetical protein
MHSRPKPGFSRRSFLKSSLLSGAGLWLGGCAAEKRSLNLAPAPGLARPPALTGIKVNDSHAQLTSALVSEVLTPTSLDQRREILRAASQTGKAISVAGGRHSMGGQQFCGWLRVDRYAQPEARAQL